MAKARYCTGPKSRTALWWPLGLSASLAIVPICAAITSISGKHLGVGSLIQEHEHTDPQRHGDFQVLVEEIREFAQADGKLSAFLGIGVIAHSGITSFGPWIALPCLRFR